MWEAGHDLVALQPSQNASFGLWRLGRLVLRGCTPAIPCKPVEVEERALASRWHSLGFGRVAPAFEDPCRYNATDCSTPIGFGLKFKTGLINYCTAKAGEV